MILAGSLLPLTVAAPLAVGALLLASAHRVPPRLADVASISTATAVAVLCAYLAAQAGTSAPTQWFGDWRPLGGVSLGIVFTADTASASVACLVAFVVAASLVFAWGYFDEVHAHFHVMMLLFLAAMVGFSLTRDLFNMFVWFELMSVSAYALTAYKLGASSLEGALNFTVVNSVASIAMLAGVGLLYARAGQLDFAVLGQTLCRRGPDPVAAGGFCLIATALLTKAAVVPFQAWLPDAHGVAPSPVSVIFSAVMAPLGLFGLAKLEALVFADCSASMGVVRHLLLPLGCATAVMGGGMAWCQRHLKRLLGFSTVAHMGVGLIALGALDRGGLAGFLGYLTGHALVKGTLFMIAGVLLATRKSNDELVLRGRGRGLGLTGPLMALAGLFLAGLPWGVMHAGAAEVEATASQTMPFIGAASIMLGSGLTGAAVLRSAGRIFWGLGPEAGVEHEGPTEPEREKANRPLWLMLAPCCAMLLANLWPTGSSAFLSAWAASGLIRGAPHGLDAMSLVSGGASVALAVFAAGAGLYRHRSPRALVKAQDALGAMFRPLRDLHSGLVGDYLAWTAVGVAALAIAFLAGA